MSAPTSVKLPKLMGHRGARALAPENTLAAMAASLHAGVPWVEIDVVLTADVTPVVHHDSTMLRCFGDPRRLARVGANTLPEDLPTLAETLAFLVSNDMGLYLELKVHKGSERLALLQASVRALEEAWASSPGFKQRCFLASFDPAILALAQRRFPTIARAFITTAFSAKRIRMAKDLGCFAICPHWRNAHAKNVRAAKHQGLGVACWTVNSTDAAKTLWRRGVDCVVTDDPKLLAPYADAGDL